MKNGNLGEVSVIKELTRQGYEVYMPICDNAKYDILAYKDSVIYRVEVKSTARKSKHGCYTIQLKRVRSNRTTNKCYHFDNKAVDLLAVYLEDIDRVILYDSKEVTQKATMNIRI